MLTVAQRFLGLIPLIVSKPQLIQDSGLLLLVSKFNRDRKSPIEVLKSCLRISDIDFNKRDAVERLNVFGIARQQPAVVVSGLIERAGSVIKSRQSGLHVRIIGQHLG